MLAKRKLTTGAERRKYLRLDTVFPVLFRVESADRKQILSGWIQGFTSNVSRGGICLAVNNLSPELANLFIGKKVRLALEIALPIMRRPISAFASIIWSRETYYGSNQTIIGLEYVQINPKLNNIFMRYAWGKKIILPLAVSLIIVLNIALGVNAYFNYQLTKNNKALVEKLVGILQESSQAKERIKQSSSEKLFLQEKISSLEKRINSVIKQAQQANKDLLLADRSKEFNDLIEQLTQERKALEEKLATVLHQENMATEQYILLDKKKAVLEQANLDKMYSWLKIHQNAHTGLSMSFEGDSDILNWAFTYDQALLIQAYVNFSDFARAKKILEFFANRAKREDGWFLNAYYANDGDPAEYVRHTGPNAWLGIAIMQYTNKTKDQSYLPLAEDIAGNLIALQNEDSEGGLRGGPIFQWYSTEHNLDAYAFFNMLFKLTGNNKYKLSADKVLEWLVWHTYDRQDLPVKRGKGDSTIATDTYAWSIAAIGPQKLIELGMNPDKIMEFVEKNCQVETLFKRPSGQTVKIKGFDFAPQLHVARGGVISSEWTAQMVVAFKIMAEYYNKKGDVSKAENYASKAEDYLAQLGRMIISSPSPSGQGEGCLPYATQDFVDTGHGWFTPKGSSTGSLSGTAYTLFAYYDFNPLELKE